MSFFGKCPSCGEELSFRIKDKVKCVGCGKKLQSDPKSGAILTFVIFVVVFVTYPIDWRLSIFLAAVIGFIGLSKVKCQVVDE